MLKIPRLRNLFSSIISLSSLSNATPTAKTALSSSINKSHFALFHSTSVFSEKSRKNSASSSIRFTCTVKEKRSDAKKALNNLLFHTRGSRDFLQNEWHFGEPNRDRNIKKKSPPGRGKKPRDKKTKRWHRDDETTLTDKFRESLYRKTKASSYSRDSTTGFEWREGFSWTSQSQRSKNWDDDESSCDEEPLIFESSTQRRVLGLPPNGPLKIADVKITFRSAALKWHPDKHQGPSQEVAQEKFKLCVDAYKSLCS